MADIPKSRPRAISEDVEFEAVAVTQSWPVCVSYIAQLASFAFDAYLATKSDELKQKVESLQSENLKLKNANAFRG